MPDLAWNEFWWRNITGPRSVVEQVVMALLENKMVVLKVPSDLPWRHEMRTAIHTGFSERTGSRDIVIQSIDDADDNRERSEPGRFILERFASPAVISGYREKSKETIQEYILSREVIKNSIIWVKGLDGQRAGKWIRFCQGFPRKDAADGSFLLEVHGNVSVPKSKNTECIDFDECVSSFDVQQLNGFILAEMNNCSNDWKRYISTAAASLCGTDAEVSALLLEQVDFRTEDPLEGLLRISGSGEFDRRGAEEDSDHALWHVRNNNKAELSHRVWTAQIQILFPVIELERQYYIEKFRDSIQDALNNNSVYQYGNVISEPEDVELGTLCYMMSSVTENGRMLYIPDDSDRERINFLHDCRNKLAHVSCCTPEEIAALFDRPEGYKR